MKSSTKKIILITILGVVSFRAFCQLDSLKRASAAEKAIAIASRMQRELSLSDDQTKKITQVSVDRLQDISVSSPTSDGVENANKKALAKLSKILTKEQYATLIKLQSQNKKQKDDYLKAHPGFAFSLEDNELNF